jgi:hypothetical protein
MVIATILSAPTQMLAGGSKQAARSASLSALEVDHSGRVVDEAFIECPLRQKTHRQPEIFPGLVGGPKLPLVEKAAASEKRALVTLDQNLHVTSGKSISSARSTSCLISGYARLRLAAIKLQKTTMRAAESMLVMPCQNGRKSGLNSAVL